MSKVCLVDCWNSVRMDIFSVNYIMKVSNKSNGLNMTGAVKGR